MRSAAQTMYFAGTQKQIKQKKIKKIKSERIVNAYAHTTSSAILIIIIERRGISNGIERWQTERHQNDAFYFSFDYFPYRNKEWISNWVGTMCSSSGCKHIRFFFCSWAYCLLGLAWVHSVGEIEIVNSFEFGFRLITHERMPHVFLFRWRDAIKQIWCADSRAPWLTTTNRLKRNCCSDDSQTHYTAFTLNANETIAHLKQIACILCSKATLHANSRSVAFGVRHNLVKLQFGIATALSRN